MQEDAKAGGTTRGGDDPQRYKMRVLFGAEVNEVLLTKNSGVEELPGDETSWTATGMSAPRPRPNAEAHGPKPAETGPVASTAGPTADHGYVVPAKSGTDSRNAAFQARKFALPRQLKRQVDCNQASDC